MRVRYTKLALEDIEAVYIYTALLYDERTARDFLATLRDGIEALALFPTRGREGRLRGTRELVLPETPFVAVYRVAGDEVHALTIIHTRRQWPRRL